MSEPNRPAARVRRMHVADLRALLEREEQTPPALIDVREPYEYEAGHLAAAVNIPLAELPERLHEVARERPIFVCQMGGRSLAACHIALQAGFTEPANLEGGMSAWVQAYGPEFTA